jgi:hypothetical protein
MESMESIHYDSEFWKFFTMAITIAILFTILIILISDELFKENEFNGNVTNVRELIIFLEDRLQNKHNKHNKQIFLMIIGLITFGTGIGLQYYDKLFTVRAGLMGAGIFLSGLYGYTIADQYGHGKIYASVNTVFAFFFTIFCVKYLHDGGHI